jgi:hypothetical protein
LSRILFERLCWNITLKLLLNLFKSVNSKLRLILLEFLFNWEYLSFVIFFLWWFRRFFVGLRGRWFRFLRLFILFFILIIAFIFFFWLSELLFRLFLKAFDFLYFYLSCWFFFKYIFLNTFNWVRQNSQLVFFLMFVLVIEKIKKLLLNSLLRSIRPSAVSSNGQELLNPNLLLSFFKLLK